MLCPSVYIIVHYNVQEMGLVPTLFLPTPQVLNFNILSQGKHYPWWLSQIVNLAEINGKTIKIIQYVNYKLKAGDRASFNV